MIATELIQNDIEPLSRTTKIARALSLMEEYKVLHLPVAENGEFLGLVSEEQLLDADDEMLSLEQAHMQMVDISMPGYAHMFDAIAAFGEHGASILPIVNEEKKYLGYILPRDIVMIMGNMLSSKIPGGIVVLQVNQYDYQLSQIAQIVESNDAKIIASFITSDAATSRIEVTLRINRTDLSSVLKTFERYKYTVVVAFHKSIHAEDLQERYDNFMNYLNM